MKDSRTLRRLLIISTLIVLSTVVAAGVYTRASNPQKNQTNHGRFYDPAKVKSAPPVVSKVKDLEISQVTLIYEGTIAAAIEINVTNNRDEAVMALDFSSGPKGDGSGLTLDGLSMEDGPMVAIPPHTLKTFRWGLGEIMEGQTVVLDAAEFADGKEEGDKFTLNAMKIQRRHFQENQRNAKAKKGDQ
jgi:hypothetical protein